MRIQWGGHCKAGGTDPENWAIIGQLGFFQSNSKNLSEIIMGRRQQKEELNGGSKVLNPVFLPFCNSAYLQRKNLKESWHWNSAAYVHQMIPQALNKSPMTCHWPWRYFLACLEFLVLNIFELIVWNGLPLNKRAILKHLKLLSPAFFYFLSWKANGCLVWLVHQVWKWIFIAYAMKCNFLRLNTYN